MQQNKNLLTIATIFVALIIISNITSTKITEIGPLVMDGGTIFFFIVYILGDVITEVYGYKTAKKVIWLGFFANLMLALSVIAVGALPPAADWPFQQDFMNILGLTPRIILGSLIAYLAGSFANAKIMSVMKVCQKGRHLWMRTIGSTLVGEGIDTILFVLIAFYGILPPSALIAIMLTNYVIKCSGEILATPVTYQLVRVLNNGKAQ